MSPRRGRFITFEGLDGTGKSTQLTLLAEYLQKRGFEVVATRNPGGTQIGERVRSILLDSRTSGLTALAEMGLMFADRAQHVEQVILPALARGKFVLCDRYTDSSEAYQGYGRGLGSETILAMHRLLCRDLWPELTILLQFGLESSLARARSRNQKQIEVKQQDENRFEREDREFYARVAHGYAEIARREVHRVVAIDATGQIESSHKQIVKALEGRFQEIAAADRPRTAGAKK